MSTSTKKLATGGSIRKRFAGSYTIVYDIAPHPDGRRRQRTESVKGTREDAKKRLVQRLAEIAAGTFVDASRMTFGELADAYLAAKTSKVEATSLAWYKRTLDQHIRPAIGKVVLENLKPVHVQAVLDNARDVSRTKRNGQPLGPSSQRNVLIAVRAILAWGVRMGLLVRNVAEIVEPPKGSHREVQGMDGARVKAILAAAAGTELEAIVTFAIATGLRRGEICALQWGDVDLAEGKFSVRRAAKIVDGKVVTGAPKTKRSSRTEMLAAFAVSALQRHRAAQAARHLQLGLGNRGPESYVFDRPDGSQWNPNLVSQKFSRLVRGAKLPACRFHDLRHGYASIAFAAGVSLKDVSESLGHSSIAVTSSTYVHLLEESKRKNAATLDAFIGDVFRTGKSSR